MQENLEQKSADVTVLSRIREAEEAAPDHSAAIEVCSAVDGLAAIQRPGTALAIWCRTLPLCLQSWIDDLDAECLPDLRVLVEPDELRHAVEPELDACGMPSGEMRDLLLADVERLVAKFSEITGSDLVDVRLERVTHDACWKFHLDRVDARLLMTYRGPATEWVSAAYAEQALREQKSFTGPIEQFDLHDVVLFKGSRAGSGVGIVHRSPPIEGTGDTRLLLCLNKPSVTSPAPWSLASGNS